MTVKWLAIEWVAEFWFLTGILLLCLEWPQGPPKGGYFHGMKQASQPPNAEVDIFMAEGQFYFFLYCSCVLISLRIMLSFSVHITFYCCYSYIINSGNMFWPFVIIRLCIIVYNLWLHSTVYDFINITFVGVTNVIYKSYEFKIDIYYKLKICNINF